MLNIILLAFFYGFNNAISANNNEMAGIVGNVDYKNLKNPFKAKNII